MPRLNHLEDILFPVELRPVFAFVGCSREQRRVRIPGKRAVVNMANHRAVGVVSSGYRLVTNREAVDAARQCCREVFPETQPSEWQVNAVDAPSTGGYCHIDLVHNTSALDFEYLLVGERPDVPEVFGPFIRVTNSYNGQRALAFSIGFFRKICKNGMVGSEVIIHFRFNHSRSDLGEGIKFQVEYDRLSKMKNSFLECFQALRDCPVSRPHFESLIQGVLLLKGPKELKPETREAAEWLGLQQHLKDLSERYARDQGENAYAVLNGITEFASHPPENQHVRRDKHSFQRLAGEWVTTFTKQCRQPSFSIDAYLEELAKDSPAGSSTNERATHFSA